MTKPGRPISRQRRPIDSIFGAPSARSRTVYRCSPAHRTPATDRVRLSGINANHRQTHPPAPPMPLYCPNDARVSATRTFADDLCVQANGFHHIHRFDLDQGSLVFDPFQAVTGDFSNRRLHLHDLVGRARQRRGDAVDGNWDVLHKPMQTPEPGAPVVFIDRFHVPVPLTGPWCGAHAVRQEAIDSRLFDHTCSVPGPGLPGRRYPHRVLSSRRERTDALEEPHDQR